MSVLDPWKIPAASQFDLNASYRFKIGKLDAILSGNVNNLLDYQYISKAFNPNTLSSSTLQEATAENIYCYYAFGRTYLLTPLLFIRNESFIEHRDAETQRNK